MDLHTVQRWVPARRRADLHVSTSGSAVVAGGTWMFASPQTHLRTLVDLTTMDWPDHVRHQNRLELAATCPVARLRDLVATQWPATALVDPCIAAFASSPKVQELATVGGNVCVALPAGPMISLLVALDGSAHIWCPDGSARDLAVRALVTGPARNSLAPGEVIRRFDIPLAALRSRTAFRRASFAPQGRSGAIVIARAAQDSRPGGAPADGVVVTVTAGTQRPHRLAFDRAPAAAELTQALDGITDWLEDHHGSPAWRQAMVRRFAAEVVEELAPA